MVRPFTVASTRVYSGRAISVDVDDVRFPDGRVGPLEMVRHPGASAVVPFLSDPRGPDPQVLLIRQFRYAAEQFLYEIPAGKLDGGEDPLVCAGRELEEEAGCVADRIEHLITIYTTPGFTDEQIHLYMASGLTRTATSHEVDEYIEVTAVAMSEVLEMIRRGEIVDGKSIIALLYAAGFRLGS
jgi:ADP-ribose pyrophosphatase